MGLQEYLKVNIRIMRRFQWLFLIVAVLVIFGGWYLSVESMDNLKPEDQIIQEAVAIVRVYYSSFDPAAFPEVIVEYEGDEPRIRFKNHIIYAPLNSDFYANPIVFKKSVSNSRIHNPEGFRVATPEFYKPSTKGNEAIAFIVKFGFGGYKPAEDALILEQSDYYEIRLETNYSYETFKINKTTGEVYDRSRKIAE